MARGVKKTDYQGRARQFFIERGYLVETVERKNCWTGLSHDFLGFGDFMAFKIQADRVRRIIVQASSGSSHAAHYKKITTTERYIGKGREAREVLAAQYMIWCGFEIVLITYSQQKKTGKKWIQRTQRIGPRDFTQ